MKAEEKEIRELEATNQQQEVAMTSQKEASNRQMVQILDEIDSEEQEIISAARDEGWKNGMESQKQILKEAEAELISNGTSQRT